MCAMKSFFVQASSTVVSRALYGPLYSTIPHLSSLEELSCTRLSGLQASQPQSASMTRPLYHTRPLSFQVCQSCFLLMLPHCAGDVPLVQCRTEETWQASQLAWSVFYVQLYRSLKQLVNTYVAHTINYLQPGHMLTFQFSLSDSDRGSFYTQNTASEARNEECLVEQHVVHNHSTESYYCFVALLSSVFILCWLFPFFIPCCSFLSVVNYIYWWLWRLLASNLLASVSNPLGTFLEPQTGCIASAFKRAWLNTVVHLSTVKDLNPM